MSFLLNLDSGMCAVLNSNVTIRGIVLDSHSQKMVIGRGITKTILSDIPVKKYRKDQELVESIELAKLVKLKSEQVKIPLELLGGSGGAGGGK